MMTGKHMRTLLQCYLVISLILFSALGYTKASDNCLSINADFDQLQALSEQGKYRFVNQLASKDIPKFSYELQQSYQSYLDFAMQKVIALNPRAKQPCPVNTATYQQLAKQHGWRAQATIAQLVAPFELQQANNDKAILLIHGLTDSPFSFHDIAQFFYQQGFNVRTLLLPGHGTAPSDLLNVHRQAWLQAASYAIERTLLDYQQVYLGGLSTGGTLIFDHLMHQQQVDSKIKGLFMWSPASKAKSDLAWLAKYVDYIPFIDWIDLEADADFAKYESFPYNAAAQVHELMSSVVANQDMAGRNMHDIPVFSVVSEHDQTIDTEHTLSFISRWQQGSSQQQNKHSTLIYYGDKENIPAQLPKLLKVINPKCQQESLCADVFDVSHISTTNAPDNPHYGVTGAYRNCGHYLKDEARYQACKTQDKVIKGEVTQANITKAIPLKRLTYNPYYQEMLSEILVFLAATH